MKKYYFVLCIIASITGCSTNYYIGRYASPEDYYKIFNYEVTDKTLTVVTTNDSIQAGVYKAEIKSDTLYLYHLTRFKEKKEMLLSQIKSINYLNNDLNNPSANITSSSGQKFNAENIRTTKDSIYFFDVNPLIIKSPISLKLIKEVRYNERKKGIPMGIFAGAICGVAASYTALSAASSEQPDIHSREQNWGSNTSVILLGGLSGGIIGGIIGWFIGSDTFFHF